VSEKQPFWLVPVLTVLALALAPAAAYANAIEGHPEFLTNGKLMTTERVPFVGDGPIKINGKNGNPEMECGNVLFGAFWNELTERTPGGEKTELRGHGQILEWWAMGHEPTAERKEATTNCFFVYTEGTEKFKEVGWVTAERPLNIKTEQGLICRNPATKIGACPATEKEPATLITEVKREELTVPWNVELVTKEGFGFSKIGVPTQTGKSCQEVPAPPGCIRLTIVVPGLNNLQIPFEGSLETFVVNGVKNALSPSAFNFESEKSGTLTIPEQSETRLVMSGGIKFFGYTGTQLITDR
jgi:hypothetical protein